MKLKDLLDNLQECFSKHGNIDIADIFRNDYGDNLVLEGYGPSYKRYYVDWDLEDR